MKRPIERVGARKSLAESVDFAVLWGLLFVVLVQVGYAGDDWPGFRGNPQLTGVAAGAVPEKLELLWTFEAGDGIEATAALVRGRAYLTSLDGYLYALDLEEGNVRWKYRAGAEIKRVLFVKKVFVLQFYFYIRIQLKLYFLRFFLIDWFFILCII